MRKEPEQPRSRRPHPDDAVTVETPVVKRVVQPDDVTQTVPVPKVDPAAETSVLPPVRPGEPRRDRPAGTGRTPSASRPTTRHSQESPADRVPPGVFRDAGNDVTRELPALDEDGLPRRTRSEWAETTPLDDLPTLADELLGSRPDDEGDDDRPRRRR